MNKLDYLDMLKDYLLKSYSEEECLEIIRDYEEYFLNGKLDGKTEQEIILELGSPKKVVEELICEDRVSKSKNNGVFSGVKNKFENWFEKNISRERYNVFEKNTMEIENLKQYSIFLTFGLFFVSFIMLLTGNLSISAFTGILAIAVFFVGVFSFKNKINMISIVINIVFIMLFILGALKLHNSNGLFALGIMLGFCMVVLNLISFFIRFRGGFLLMILTFMLLLIALPAILLWAFFVGITIFGVGVAIFLTPYTISGLGFLSMNYSLIIFPIILAVGLFVMMCIIIYYYSKFLYKSTLYYINWLKIKIMYSVTYTNYEKKEVSDES